MRPGMHDGDKDRAEVVELIKAQCARSAWWWGWWWCV